MGPPYRISWYLLIIFIYGLVDSCLSRSSGTLITSISYDFYSLYLHLPSQW